MTSSRNAMVEGVEATISWDSSFPDQRDVKISFSIHNRSGFPVQFISTNGLEDLRVELSGPDGRRIEGYHERAGTSIAPGIHKRRFITSVAPGSGQQMDALVLSEMWPLDQIGGYRCQLTKQVYQLKEPKVSRDGGLESQLGTPIHIRLPAVEFRIERVDPSFVPVAATMVRKANGGVSPAKEEVVAGWQVAPWLGIGIAFAAAGWLIRRRARLPSR